MSNRVNQFEAAYMRWEALRDAQKFSVAQEVGKTAIIVSSYVNLGFLEEGEESEDIIFLEEAAEIADEITEEGGTPQIISATQKNIEQAIRDPEVSDIITIGHGRLGNLTLNTGSHTSWYNIAAMVTHLKQGTFFQRQCGLIDPEFTVPMGFFAVSDHRNIIAAAGVQLPNLLKPHHERHFQRLFDFPKATIADLEVFRNMGVFKA